MSVFHSVTFKMTSHIDLSPFFLFIVMLTCQFYAHCVHSSQDLDVIFSNILDIYEFTAKLLSSVEEQVEVAQDNEVPLVGTCFEDLAEVSNTNTKYCQQRVGTFMSFDAASNSAGVVGLLLGSMWKCRSEGH